MIPRGGSRKGYPLRRAPQGSYSIAIETKIGKLIPEGTHFRAELVEEGILLRPVRETLPGWLKGES